MSDRKLAFLYSPEAEALSYPPECPFKSQRAGLTRLRLKSFGLLGDENRFETEQDAFYRRARKQYLKIAAREPIRMVLIEGDHSIKEVHEQIFAAVTERLSRLGARTPHPSHP